MGRTPSDAASAKAFAAARMARMSGDLDGYPASTLLDYCLDAVGVEDALLVRRQWMVDYILMRWSETLTLDIDQLPPCSIDSLVAIRQRMINARNALHSVRAIVQGLRRLAEVRLEVVDEPSAAEIWADMTKQLSFDPRPQSAS